jgi:hypothetical protein
VKPQSSSPRYSTRRSRIIQARKLLRRGSFESQGDLENQITEFTVGYDKTAHPWKRKYDANAEHARYLQRHPEKASVTRPPDTTGRGEEPLRDYCAAALASPRRNPR